VPAALGGRVADALRIPVVGIGAGPDCDAQILVWPDMAGLTAGRLPRFVQQYADVRGSLLDAARRYTDDVAARRYPDEAHSYA
jgi:3-methyl-2-oxobutanoate hydroxymethyltransferase